MDTKKVLALLEENLHLLKNKPFIFLEPVVRKINDNTFQTVYYDPAKDGEIGWTFSTWQIDNEFAVSLVDSTTYNNDTTRHGTEIAKYWFELWNKSDNHYVPYKNITLYENLLEQAKIGKLIGAEFNIGTAIEQIKAKRSGAMEEGYYEGAKYLFYPEDTYFYDEITGEVVAIGLNGNRLKLTLNEIKEKLGSPTEEDFHSLEGERFICYALGDYDLYFYENELTKLISNVILSQNHQCELVVCSSAESLYYRPRPKRPTERFPTCTTFPHQF